MPGSRFLLVLLSLVVGLVGPLSTSGAAGAPPGEWGPVRDVSAGAQDVWDLDLAQAGGKTFAVWLRSDGGRTRLLAATKTGAGWSTPRGVPGSADVVEVEAGLDRDGAVVLVWSVGRSVLGVRRPAGGAWAKPVVLHRTAGGVRGTRPGSLQLAVNEHGYAVAAWATIDDDMDGVYATSRVQAVVGTRDGSWSDVRTLSARRYGAAVPEVAVDRSGRATVVWSEYRGEARRVMTASRPEGADWLGVRRLAGAATQPGQPHLAAQASGRLAVAWSVFDQGVRVRRWSPRTGWTAAAVVPKARVRVTWLDVGTDDSGRVTVAWSNNVKSVWTASQRPGGRWQVVRVAPVGSVFYGMEVAVNRTGDAIVAWVDVRDGDHPVEGAYRDRSGSWGPMTMLSPRRGDSFGPVLAVNDRGEVTAAWIYDGPRRNDTRIQSREYSAR